ncbi:hypothetical protein CPT_Moonbeam145 [Bacillus phage Moonbeam]|uniref:Lipoprotein n=1 Tax=Bacillus phage Moonbeam TaxID=1540091 RepID=A0A0A0RV77_9CAUD|nr:hypothetical protein CPT_Moonbeam145 [Bacillus phage Moonbeam]AIW03543.1 hypothetical protein CPT_Moonbeam145 [Bacillus phage Moonbeam]
MRRRIRVPIVLATLLFAAVGCQQVADKQDGEKTSGSQHFAKKFGGTATLDLPKGEKLMNITWKDDHLWYLTRPMTKEDKAETYKFKESSNFGILEGEIVVKERKK